jgi:hypothetical protein
MFVSVTALVALVVAAVVIGSYARGLRKDGRLTQPLGRVAGLYGRFLVVYLVLAVFSAFHGFSGNDGPSGSLCVDTGYPNTGGAVNPGVFAKHGAVINSAGGIRTCALHPGLGQWALFLLTRLPSLILWAVVLVLILRLVSQATRTGPFSPLSAVIMRQLGWVVIGGSMIAEALAELGTDVLTRMLMSPPPYDTKGILFSALVAAPFRALFPVPALAGAALLTFARITRAGAIIEEEIRATV